MIVSVAQANPGLVRMHQGMDVNQDGMVSNAEFMNFWGAHFSRMDANGDQILGVDGHVESFAIRAHSEVTL